MHTKSTHELLVSALFLDSDDPRRLLAEHTMAGNRSLTGECLMLRTMFREMAAHPLQPGREGVSRILDAIHGH